MQGKSVIVVISILLLTGLIVWFSNNYYLEGKENRAYEKRINSIEVLYSNLLLSKESVSGYITIVYFHSECEHCQREMNDIGKHIDKFTNTELVLVSSEPQSQAITFLSKYGLANYYVFTREENIINTFIGGVPQIFIYENGNLEKHFPGETKVEDILKIYSNS